MKLKKRTTTHTEMQTATNTGIPPGSCQLQPRDHFAIRALLRPWNEGHIFMSTLVPPGALLHPQIGDILERIIEAVGETCHAEACGSSRQSSLFTQISQKVGSKSVRRHVNDQKEVT